MCCEDTEVLDLPPSVIEMVARYRRMRDEQGFGWGEDALPDFFRWARFAHLGPAFDELAATGDWGAAVRTAVGDDVPAGLVLVTVLDDGLDVRAGPARPVIAGPAQQIDVVLDSAAARDHVVTVDDEPVPVPAGGAGLAVRDLDADRAVIVVEHAGVRREIVAVVPVAAAELRLTSPEGARWSVTDPTGGAWFADGVPHKWDAAERPYFHTGPGTVTLRVPAGPLHVEVARGVEFERAVFEVEAPADVEHHPVRRFHPAADGWYGADLHVHLNYSGDLVLDPADARRMQVGEGLALMQLAAGNLGGAMVYDRELLEATVGTDLWAGPDGVARAGLEFRNGLLGHVHGLGLTGVPEIMMTGDEGTEHPWDWPPNEVAVRRMRELGAVTTYAHPVFAPGEGPEDLFRPWRMVEARELVADAAAGVVDAVELASCFDDEGARVLYHHLLSCGLRLAATAGTDAFLSFSRGPDPASNPPGWNRVYARLDGPLSVAAFSDAVRAGRTLVTNGPWLTLDVDGHGPGAELDRRTGDRVRVRATSTGSGVERLVLYGPDGEIARVDDGALDHELTVHEGLWLAAAAHGVSDDPYTPGAPVFAHTSPVWVDVDGARVARPASARWCLALLDGVQDLAAEQGRFDPHDHDRQFADLVAVLDRARTFYRAIADR